MKNFLRGAAIPAALFFLALGARLLFLGKQSLWLDEGFSFWMGSLPLSRILSRIRFDAHPPLYYFFLHFWEMGGRKEAYLRLPSTFFGAISCVGVYFLGKELLDRKTALVSAAFWAFSAAALYEDTQVRMYAPAVTLSLFATIFLLRALKSPSSMNRIAYIFFSLLSLYTHYFTGFIILAHLFFLALTKRFRETFWAAAILAIFFSPWIPTFIRQFSNGVDTTMQQTTGKQFFYFFAEFLGTTFGATEFLPFHYNLFVALAGAIFPLIGLARLAATKKKKEQSIFLGLLFLIPLLVPFAITQLTVHHIFMFRYITLVLPYFFLLFFFGFLRLPNLASYPCLTALLLINFSFWILFSSGSAYQRQDWRDASALLSSSLASGDAIFIEQRQSIFPLAYYMPESLQVGYNTETGLTLKNPEHKRKITWYVPRLGFFEQSPKGYFQVIRKAVQKEKRVWLVLCEAEFIDPHHALQKWLLQHEHLESYYSFRGIERASSIEIFLFHVTGGKHSKGQGREGH